MLEKIDRNDIPGPGGRGKSPARAFAEETLVAFLDGYGPGEVAEVTGWPVDEGRDAAWNADRAVRAIDAAAYYMERGQAGRGAAKGWAGEGGAAGAARLLRQETGRLGRRDVKGGSPWGTD